MFRAITKGNGGPSADAKGTLTAFWNKKAAAGAKEPQEAAAGSDTPAPAPPHTEADGDADAATTADFTPAAAGRSAAAQQADGEAGREEPEAATTAAPLTCGGDVAINAAPDPSPEPAAAAAVVAAAEVVAEPQAEAKLSKASTDKKRKRAPGAAAACDGLSQEQLSKLQVLFADSPYATTAAKSTLAEESGLDLAQVNKWFEKQRKKVREETGGAPKRGRPKSTGGGKAAVSAASAAAPGAAAAVAAGQPAGALAAELGAAAATMPAAAAAAAEEEQQAAADGMEVEVDAEPAVTPVSEAALAAAWNALHQQDAAAAANAAAILAADAAAGAPAAAAAAAPMAADEADVQGEGQTTPAAALRPTGVQEAAEEQQPASEQQPAAAAVASAAVAAPDASPAGDGATPAGTAAMPLAAAPAAAPAAAAPAAKTPATAPQQRSLSAEAKAQLMAELTEQAAQLRLGGLAAPLHALPAEPAPAERQAFSDARLAAYVAGQRAPLSQLAAALLPLFRAPDSEAALEEAVLRSRIIDLAARKSFGPKDGGSGLVDGLEDDTGDHVWQWELRDQKVLPKELRPAAQQAKKRAARVQERLTAMGAALRLLTAHKEGKAAAKLSKALDALNKVKTLAQIEVEQQVERQAAAAKQTAKKHSTAGGSAASAAAAAAAGATAEGKERQKAEKEAAKEADRAAKEAAREAEKSAKEAEKEAEKAAKEAEKEKARVEKEAEKEKQRVEKEAEKERAKAEKERKLKEAEELKLAKKSGYKDPNAAKKASTNFMSYFQPKQAAAAGAGAAATPASRTGAGGSGGDASSGTPARPAASSQQQAQVSQQVGGGGASQATSGATGKKEKEYCELFLKPEAATVRSLPPKPSAADAMDGSAGLPHSFQQAQADWQQLLATMKQRRRHGAAAAMQARRMALPPNWARKPNAVELAQQHMDKLQESGADLATVKTWRRKFIWFPANSERPAYYGSCTKPSPAVRARQPFGRDDALDYEVMSDLDWEEEPEDASSLSDAEDMSAMGGGQEEEDEEHNSFICADDYLSDDEGVGMEDLDDGMDCDTAEGLPEGAAAAAGIDAQRLLCMQQLEQQMDRARRAGKPLIISRLPTAASSATSAQSNGTFIQGDVSLLAALAAEVLLPGLRVTMPEDPAAEAAAAAAAPATAAKETSPAGAAGGTAVPTDAAKPSVGTKRERPDDLLPELLRLLRSAPRSTKQKIGDEFLSAHPARKIPKKWVQDRLKEHALWQGTVRGWALKPDALQLIDPAAAAAVGGLAGGAAAPTPSGAAAAAAAADNGAAVGTAGPAAAAGGAAGCGGAAAGAGAADLAAAAAAAGAVEPTPAAAKPASAAGGIERFLFKKGAMGTPAVPAALRPNAPPSDLKAPGRLVTTTAAGVTAASAAAAAATAGTAAAALPPLVVPEAVSGTADPFWRLLVQHIEGADSPAAAAAVDNKQAGATAAAAAASFVAAFQPAVLARLVGGMPAGVLTSLVTGVAAGSTPGASRAAYLRCLEAAVLALAAAEAEAAGDNLSASQQVWQPRGAPTAASLAELCREPQLLDGLQACIEAATAAAATATALVGAGGRGGTEAEAGQAAAAVAAALLASGACRAALAAGAGGNGGCPQQQLAALVQAVQCLTGACTSS